MTVVIDPSGSLIAVWPLATDTNDHGNLGLLTTAVDVDLGEAGPKGITGTAARFNGRTSVLTVPNHAALQFGTNDLTVTAWVRSDDPASDIVGDIVSKFDPSSRRGLQLGIVTNSGVTSTAQSNYRHLHFGIDAAQIDEGWTDCGRPGNAVFITSLAVCNGHLYAGTFESGEGEQGRLWRYDGGQRWVDLGNPVGCNAISSIVAFEGELYCGTGRYMGAGSALGPTKNHIPGGKVYRVTPDGDWTECGHPGAEGATPEEQPVEGYATGKADEVLALTVYRGELYCAGMHRRGVFKYQGSEAWTAVGLDDWRLMSIAVYRDQLFALTNGGPVYRYLGGNEWVSEGHPDRSEQTYAGVISEGNFYVGTWPECEVFRFEGAATWQRIGRVGFEREVMGMVNYNGKVYLGTLPMANVWRMDDDRFTFIGTIDHASAPLRRVWSMAVYQGRLFAGTLPSGRICSIEAGRVATWDRTFPAGWHHIAAVKSGSRLKLWVDGQLVAWSRSFYANDYDLTNDRPLLIGAGAYEHFTGLISDVRLYGRALTEAEINGMAS